MGQALSLSLCIMHEREYETESLGTDREQNLLPSLLAIKNPDLPPFSLNCIGQQRLYLSVQLVTVRTLWAQLSNWNQDSAQYNGFPLVSAGQTNDIGEVREMAYWWLSEPVVALRSFTSLSLSHPENKSLPWNKCLTLWGKRWEPTMPHCGFHAVDSQTIPTVSETLDCGVPHGSVLDPFLFPLGQVF